MRKLPNQFLAAMVAVRALPGSLRYESDDEKIVRLALSDLALYEQAEVDAVILENDHDLPYIKPPLPQAAVQLMTRIAKEARQRFEKPIGIQMLEAANETALEIAVAADLDFLRVEGYVFAHVGGAGIIEGCAGQLLRKRKELDAEHIKVYADIKKKHCAHALTADLGIVDELKQAEFFQVDGVVVTSQYTGVEPDLAQLQRVQKAAKVPVLIGSGMDKDNIEQYLPHADGFIVGSTFRNQGEFLEEIEPTRLYEFMERFHQLRQSKS